MKIHCINCGHSIDLGDAYSDYTGPVRCLWCRSFLDIKIRDGKVRSMKPMAAATEPVEQPAGNA